MKKLLFTFFWVILALVLTPSFAYAHKVGVNIGTQYNLADQAIQTVGPGGWIVVIASPGDCDGLQEIATKAESANVNLIIRGHLNNKLSPEDAKGWTATLGNIKTSKLLYFMPWNEPNQEGTPDYGSSQQVIAYTDALINNLSQSGLRGSKVFLLSPMINQSHHNFSSYVSSLGGGSFFSKFDGIAMNLYDFGSFKNYDPLTNGNPNLNPLRLQDVLAQMAAGGKPAFGVESGTVLDYKVRYIEPQMSQFAQAMIDKVNPAMFALGAYDLAGEEGKKFNLFNTNAAKILKNYASSNPGGATGNSFNETVFKNWLTQLQTNGEIIQCGTSCGFAPKENPGLCTSTAGGGYNRKTYIPSRKITTNDTVRSVSDTVILSQKSPAWPVGAVGSTTTTKGGFFEEFQDLTIPFAKNLTEYLAGPFVYQYNSYIKEVLDEKNALKFRPLANLTPSRIQDEFRYNYWQNCKDKIFCSSQNTDPIQCPSKENNECLISDGKTEMQELCPPPRPEFKDLPSFCPKNMDDWQNAWASKWSEIPFFSNPKTEVKDSILMNTCPAPTHVSTTTLTRTPWVSALNDVSGILNKLFTSKMQQEGAGFSAQFAKKQENLKLLASVDLLAQAYSGPTVRLPLKLDDGQPPVNGEYTIGWKVCAGERGLQGGCPIHDFNLSIGGSSDNGTVSGGGDIVTGWGGGQGKPGGLTHGQCFTTGNNGVGPFRVEAGPGDKFSFTATLSGSDCNGKKATISETCTTTFTADGWTICVPGTPFGGGTIQPPKCDPPGIPNFVFARENTDPVYSEGHTLLKEDRSLGCLEWEMIGGGPHCKKLKDQLEYTIKDPAWAEIEYPFLGTVFDNLTGFDGLFMKLFKPSQMDFKDWDYAGESKVTYCLTDHPAGNMIKGGSLQIDKQTFEKPPARCKDLPATYTRGVRAFPPLIGGVYNAKLWVVNEMLQPANQ